LDDNPHFFEYEVVYALFLKAPYSLKPTAVAAEKLLRLVLRPHARTK
jgi:hypothetical protein